MDSQKYKLETPFVTDDPYFALGFEAGMIYERLKRTEPFTQMIHASNLRQVTLICEGSGRRYQVARVDELWVELIVDLRLFVN